MLAGFEKNVADFLKARDLLRPGDKILLAISGGADSLALLYCLHSLNAARTISASLCVAHINHQLRGSEADADERFVIEQAGELNLPLTTRRVDVNTYAKHNKLSIETAARKLRSQALINIAQETGCHLIATAHNKNDNAETILHRLMRGTGLRGLAGIWPRKTFPQNITFIRPLLWAGRDEIIEYLRQHNLKWRHDRTNLDAAHTRNYIRHHLLPVLQAQCAGSLVDVLADLARHCRRYYSEVAGRCEKAWPDVVTSKGPHKLEFGVNVFSKYPPWVKVELARKALNALGCGEQALTHLHYKKILQLAEVNISRKRITLPRKFVAIRYRNTLAFAKEQIPAKKQSGKALVLNIPGRTQFGDWLVEADVLEAVKCDLGKFKTLKTVFLEWFDLDKLKPPLQIRPRRDGDRFWPLGLACEKKIGKFITAAQVRPDLRPRLSIIADGEKIIWLAPLRPSEKTKVTPRTKRILQLKLQTCCAD